MPFLRNVTRGRNVPEARLAAVAEHYQSFGGVSPINQQCRDLLAAVEKDFAAAGVGLPVYWGNRNWDPMLGDTVTRMAARRCPPRAGLRHLGLPVLLQLPSVPSTDIAAAREQAGPGAPEIEKLRQFFNHPGFVGPLAAATRQAVATLPEDVRDGARLVFTAHSIPVSMARLSGPDGGAYPAELAEASRLVAEQAGGGPGGGPRPWQLAYQSRSGPPSVPWLEPDVNEMLEQQAAAGAPAVVLVPVGFVSDHIEVRYDLDHEAAQTAGRLGLPLARAATPGTDPAFVAMITALVSERMHGTPPVALGQLGPPPGDCPAGCCLARELRPALPGRPPAGPGDDPAPGRRAARARPVGRRRGRPAAGRPAPRGPPAVLETKSSPTDVVTALDQAAETLIRTRIGALRPGDAILGEEGGESGSGRVRWIVDPLDGTVNYLYGLPDWSVSIGVEVQGTVVAGVVNVPERGEEFCAMLGAGAWLWRAGAGRRPRCKLHRRGARWARRWSAPGSATRRAGG